MICYSAYIMQLSNIVRSLFVSLVLFTVVLTPSTALAADIRGDESIRLTNPEEQLNNPYLFGEKIEVSVPVQNDLVTGGSNISLESSVSGSIWAAGGDIEIDATVGNSVRVAGGNITINGQITEDLIVFGGNIKITKDASIGGDLIFFGGELQVDGPVGGDIRANGGEITLASTVGGNVEGEMGKLTLAETARIQGDLSYKADDRATVSDNQVNGEVTFKETNRTEEARDGAAGLIAAGTIYTLVADLLFVLLLVWLLRPLLGRVLTTMNTQSLKSAGVGFANLVLTPLAALLLLVLIWVGVGIFFLYGLLILLSLGVMKLFVGWKVLTWWEGRNKRGYDLDWKAAIVGVIIVFIIGLIPVLGWLAVFLLFLVSLGGLTLQLFSHLTPEKGKDVSSKKK